MRFVDGVDPGSAIWMLDRESNAAKIIAGIGNVDFLAWAPDGDQLFASAYSYGVGVTTVTRVDLVEDTVTTVVVPFGGAITPIAVEGELAGAYVGDVLVDPSAVPRARHRSERPLGCLHVRAVAVPRGRSPAGSQLSSPIARDTSRGVAA